MDEQLSRELDVLLLDKRGAARVLGISVRTLDYLIASGELKPRKIGRRVLLHYDQLRDFAEEGL